MNWVFFVRGQESIYVENAIARRIAVNARVIAVGPSVSFIRYPAAIRFRARVSRPADCRIETYYQPLHFPIRAPVVGAACQILNTFMFRREMQRILPDRPEVLCVCAPQQHGFVGSLRESLSIYYASDDYTVDLEGRPISGEVELERRLLEKVDQVICNTEELANRLRDRSPRSNRPPIHIIPNFYDERIFNSDINSPEPAPYLDIPRPRILVAGHISDRIDWDGIVAASSLRPDWSWIFLGRATEPDMEERIRQLGSRGFLCPRVPFEEVPAWVQHADACAIPYRLNPFTLASDPIKAPEYLAMGAPILSTRVPSLSRFDKAIYWVEEGNAESYAAALDSIHAESGNQELKAFRQQTAAADSLQVRAQQFIGLVRSFL